VYQTSITKDSTVAAKASVNSVKYKMAFRHAQWALTKYFLSFFLSLYLRV